MQQAVCVNDCITINKNTAIIFSLYGLFFRFIRVLTRRFTAGVRIATSLPLLAMTPNSTI